MTANVWQSKLHMKRVCLCGEFYGYSLFDSHTKNRERGGGGRGVGIISVVFYTQCPSVA